MPGKIDLLNRTLQLAALGLGKTSSHPLLGWVLVSNDQNESVCAEGWLPEKDILSKLLSINFDTVTHKKYALYINTFPSVTPGLVQTLSDYHISKICIAGIASDAIKEMFPREISWEDSLLLNKELHLNRRFYVSTHQQRPYIMLKWAQTADGFVARKNFDSKWISNAQSRKLVHKWRTEEDAIMVGTNTAHYDNPKLNVRNWSGRNPIRIVIDKQLRLDRQLNLFDGTQPTLCYNLRLDQVQDNLSWVRLPAVEDDFSFLKLIFEDLWERNIQSVLIEGGSKLLHTLITHQLWDEARVFSSSQSFGDGIPAPDLTYADLIEETTIGDDSLKTYFRVKS